MIWLQNIDGGDELLNIRALEKKFQLRVILYYCYTKSSHIIQVIFPYSGRFLKNCHSLDAIYWWNNYYRYSDFPMKALVFSKTKSRIEVGNSVKFIVIISSEIHFFVNL